MKTIVQLYSGIRVLPLVKWSALKLQTKQSGGSPAFPMTELRSLPWGATIRQDRKGNKAQGARLDRHVVEESCHREVKGSSELTVKNSH